MKQVKATVVSNREVTLGVHLVWLEARDIAFEAKPGQFVMVGCGDGTLLRRPLSIHLVNKAKDRLALLFATVGKGTRWLSRRKAGEPIDLFGPLGNGFSIQDGVKNLLLVAGGVGIAPLAFLADVAAGRGCAVKLHQGVDTAGQISLEALPSHYKLALSSGVLGTPAAATQYASPGTIECTASTADGSAFVRGLATICLPGLASEADQIFACGPVAMYKAMSRMAELKGKSVQVSLEVVMGCGRGICYGCTIKTKRGLKEVCTDGPVFGLNDVLWDELNL